MDDPEISPTGPLNNMADVNGQIAINRVNQMLTRTITKGPSTPMVPYDHVSDLTDTTPITVNKVVIDRATLKPTPLASSVDPFSPVSSPIRPATILAERVDSGQANLPMSGIPSAVNRTFGAKRAAALDSSSSGPVTRAPPVTAITTAKPSPRREGTPSRPLPRMQSAVRRQESPVSLPIGFSGPSSSEIDNYIEPIESLALPRMTAPPVSTPLYKPVPVVSQVPVYKPAPPTTMSTPVYKPMASTPMASTPSPVISAPTYKPIPTTITKTPELTVGTAPPSTPTATATAGPPRKTEGLMVMANTVPDFSDYAIPKYNDMSDVELAMKRAFFNTMYDTFIRAWPSSGITMPDPTADLRLVHGQFLVYRRHYNICKNAEKYRMYMIMLWVAIEVAGLWYGFKAIAGFAKSQIRAVGNYEAYLIEMSEDSYVELETGDVVKSKHPVEVRLLFLSMASVLGFMIVRFLGTFTSEANANDLVNSLYGSLLGLGPMAAENGPQQTSSGQLAGVDSGATTGLLTKLGSVLGNNTTDMMSGLSSLMALFNGNAASSIMAGDTKVYDS